LRAAVSYHGFPGRVENQMPKTREDLLEHGPDSAPEGRTVCESAEITKVNLCLTQMTAYKNDLTSSCVAAIQKHPH
jgi:hypothetical protein